MPATSQESAARRYRIEKYLTEGGMGAIYIGKKLGPGGFAKEVVLKQLLPEYTARPEFRDLFFREAKISATLDHANIVHTFDLVESDQSLFIVMEYVRGADLRTIIRRARQRKRELSPAAAIHICLEILAGLGYAHTRRDAGGKSLDIIHRDVSPSNIICSAQGAAKLSDFGIAKASTHSSVFYRVRGKVGYMSPEQARNQPIDHRCDLFSLAVCLYESLSGERLFVGDLNTPADEIYGIEIVPVSRKRAGLPPALDQVLMRALAPRVDDRYQSAAELAEGLRTVAHRSGLAFSAPELAAHLREILGADPERWLRDEPAAALTDAPDPVPVPAGDAALVGTEAESIGIVNGGPQDEAGQSVLSPRGVSGSKDFDLDSMLNDEATRPGGEERRAGPSVGSDDGSDARVQGEPGTPPPVWTRDSGPFGAPKVLASHSSDERRGLSQARGAPADSPAAVGAARPAPSSSKLPGVRPAVPSGRERPLPRATIRGAAVPPPFQPASRLSAPPPPPFPRAAAEARSNPDDIEDPTPHPTGTAASLAAPRTQPISFDIDDLLTPPPPARPPALPGVPRGAPPAPYPALALDPPVPAPAPAVPRISGSQARVLSAPQTMDFGEAVSASLPEKKSGPPGWLGAILILGALVGGAAAARRLTHDRVAGALVAGGGAERAVPTAAPHATATAAPDPVAPEPLQPTGATEAKAARPAPRLGEGDEPPEAAPAPGPSGAVPSGARAGAHLPTAPDASTPRARKHRGGKAGAGKRHHKH